MATKKKKAATRSKKARTKKVSANTSDDPQLFRVNIEVANIDEAVTFYSSLLGVVGRKSPGSRAFFPAGAASLMVVDVSSVHAPHPAAKALYFTVRDLDAAFARAQALGCLSQEDVHDKPGGGIVVRPWGERSFYVVDPWHNPLCFVEAGTVYGG
ncbi:MAG TPA: VOC family protein [Myxococcota bacterium]|jgi:predicted enzyme related to lactoylglutathione lyase